MPKKKKGVRTIKDEIWGALDDDPTLTYSQLRKIYPQYKRATVHKNFTEWKWWSESDTRKLKLLIRDMVRLFKSKVRLTSRLSVAETKLIWACERIAITWDVPTAIDEDAFGQGLEREERLRQAKVGKR